MSIWKPINQSHTTTRTFNVHKEFRLNHNSSGQLFLRFHSGSSSDFLTKDSGSYWDANRTNFYLSGSQFHFTSDTSSYWQNGFFGSPAYSLGPDNTINPQYRHKFHVTGSTLSISQYYFGDNIKPNSFELIDNSHQSGTIVIKDDGNGNLYAPSASLSSSAGHLSSSTNYIGNIFYNLGIINILATGSFSHTPSSASFQLTKTHISHSQEIHISGGRNTLGKFDIGKTAKFIINSGSVTGSTFARNHHYVTSASGHSECSESAYITALSMSKKINEQFNLPSLSGSFISSSCESADTFADRPKISLTNAQPDDNVPISDKKFITNQNIDNLPPITASLTPLIGFKMATAAAGGPGFNGGKGAIPYTNVGTGLDLVFGAEGVGSGNYEIKFNSTHTITTREYRLKVRAQDFNYTNNLTARRFGTATGSAASSSLMSSPYLNDDILSGSLSGSWGPCMTTIGFYRNYPGTNIRDNHPIMIAKYPSPIMIPPDVDITFVVRIDF